MKKLFPLLLSFMTLTVLAQDISIDLSEFATGFTRPVDIKNAGDDRLFIVEQGGTIKILNSDGTTNDTPFLEIEVEDGGNEQGLLGLAFHPDYANNGFFFVNYIDSNGNTQISRFVTSNDPDIADASSEQPVLNINQPFANHNGGCMQFGDDGYLYIALGDGGSGGDPGNRAQNLQLLLGKMLRIDIDSSENGQNYGIPDDNPFLNDSSVLPEIWAYGLRNPWKFSFDSQSNDLWIADVGQEEIEEINQVDGGLGGQNYGWRCYEGNDPFNTSGCPDESTLTFPVAQYTHSNDGEFKCSITGGYVYRGSMYQGMIGTYIFADFCSNEVGYINTEGEIVYSEPFSGGLSSFGVDVNNELYVAALNSGIIYEVLDSNLSVDEQSKSAFTIYPNPASSEVTLNNPAFAKADTYTLYDLNGRVLQSIVTQTASHTFAVNDLAAGVYLLQSENTKQTQKLIVK